MSDSTQRPSLTARFLSRRTGGMLVRNTVASTGVFLLGLAAMWAMVERGELDPVLATAISFILANSINYLFARSWVFAGTDRALVSGYTYFLANALVGLAVTVSLFWVLTTWTSMHYLVARVVVSIFAGLAVFALNGVLNFRRI